MFSISPMALFVFIASVACQVAAVGLLPATKGFTAPLPTVASAAGIVLGIGAMARLLNMGVNLSVLVPLLSAVVPLCGVAIGILLYGDSASIVKIALLVTSCGFIALAALF